jgi:hypothetical protein
VRRLDYFTLFFTWNQVYICKHHSSGGGVELFDDHVGRNCRPGDGPVASSRGRQQRPGAGA